MNLLAKFSRFSVIGAANTVIDFVVFTGLVWFAVAPLLANVIAWAVAVSFSFVANSRWTFVRNTDVGRARQMLRFVLSSAAITLGISSGALVILSDLVGVLPAKIAGVAVSIVVSFVAARWAIESRA